MTNETDNPIPVVFRAERSGKFKDTVTAVFPTDCANMRGDMGCFAHVGQHSACSREWYATTRAATPAEYAELKAELEAAPYHYRLEVYRRFPAWMDYLRLAELQRLRSRVA